MQILSVLDIKWLLVPFKIMCQKKYAELTVKAQKIDH